MRIEALLQFALAIAFIVLWVFMPTWSMSGANYSISLTPWGYVVRFFGETHVIPPPTVYAVWLFAIDAGLLPLIWRRSRYSLYLAALFSVLSISMLMDTILFQQRYLQFHGYTIAPTPTGYIYVSLPTRPVLGLPTYILLALTILSIFNMATRARWLGTRVIEDPIVAVERVLKALHIEYSRIESGVEVGGIKIIRQGSSLRLVRGSEAIEVDLKTAIIETIKAGLKQPVSVGVVDYGED
ncbi:MAG: hypothetical protein L7H00_02380 [Vulcanisaeta sp.]|jgi:hypothetical protein|nr:hypothetical protein [Vulcanisaeta sp.]MCG2894856.1 hypothetical protein [Vulcanisaeta sp.]